MKMTCKNCARIFSGHYCPDCGQSAETHRLDMPFLWHDIQHGLFHFDRGIIFTIKQLFTRPGNSIREFIEGKRIRHFKPISLLIVLASIYGILYHTFHIDMMGSEATSEHGYLGEWNEWLATHYSWITLATIPLYTVGTYLCFRWEGYNFVEYFVLNTFKASQRLSFHLFTFPLVYYLNGTAEMKILSLITYTVDIVVSFWTNIQFFNHRSKGRVILLSLVSHLIFLVLFLAIIAIVLLLSGNI